MEVMVHTFRKKPAYDLVERKPSVKGRQVFVSYHGKTFALQADDGEYYIETYEVLGARVRSSKRVHAVTCKVCGRSFVQKAAENTCSPECRARAKSLGQKRAVIARLRNKADRLEHELDIH